MQSQQRRDTILSLLRSSDTPVSATVLAGACEVTRQIIVGDIALLRASGNNIVATPRGYVIPETPGLIRRVACVHDPSGTQDELFAMVDCGCTVLDVVVEHPVYGQLTAPLQIAGRYDVEEFLSRMQECGGQPLSALTGGIHLHTLSCPNETAFIRLKALLQEKGILLQDCE